MDRAAELAEDAKHNSGPRRFAVPAPVSITPNDHGTWETVAGGRLWRLRILAPSATDLNFGFNDVWLPGGATLHVLSEAEDYVQGPYDSRDNKAHRQLWTPVIPGDRAVIELFVPTGAPEPSLTLTHIGRGYRDMFRDLKQAAAPKAAGLCNIDVACPEAAPWSNEVRSVAVYSFGGGRICTGTLINNGLSDGRPFFLTAAHCEVTPENAASVVVYWNYQSPSCGLHGGGSLAHNQNGAIFRAARVDVDMTLIELEEVPEPSFNVYYSGWDRTTNATLPGVTAIHHPDTMEKSISFSSNSVTATDNCIGTGAYSSLTHYNVVWTRGVTEPGSSGSGIWTHGTKRLVGFLSGGDSSCDTPLGPDCYGRFSVAWAGGNDPAQRLREWLDPLGTAPASLAGVDSKSSKLISAHQALLVSESCTPTNGVIDPGEMVTIDVSLVNRGGLPAGNVVATLNATGGVTAPSGPQDYGSLAAAGGSATRSFSFVASGTCGGTVSGRLNLQMDGTNSGVAYFQLPLGTPVLVFTQLFDSVPGPALPSGWANSVFNDPDVTEDSPGWLTVPAWAHTAPNSLFAPTTDGISDALLTSPAFTIPAGITNALVSFHHDYQLEESDVIGYDGGVMEISLNGGAFTDLIAAGGAFITNGYTKVISTEWSSPIAGRNAWTGITPTFIQTIARLPASAAGKSVRLRWRLASDDSETEYGWNIDTVQVIAGATCCFGGPVLTDTKAVGTNLAFSFVTIPGKTYVSEYKTALRTNVAWVPFATNAGDGTKKSVTNRVSGTNRFIRVRAN